MNAPKKKAIDIKWIITNISILGSAVTILWLGMQYIASLEYRIFDTNEDKMNTKTLVDAPYNEYQLLMKRDSVVRQGKKLQDIQEVLMTAFDTLNNRRTKDEEDKNSRVASRNSRDSLYLVTLDNQRKSDSVQGVIQREQLIQTNTNLAILGELKNIQILIDTTK
jgi:hypothetical protein